MLATRIEVLVVVLSVVVELLVLVSTTIVLLLLLVIKERDDEEEEEKLELESSEVDCERVELVDVLDEERMVVVILPAKKGYEIAAAIKRKITANTTTIIDTFRLVNVLCNTSSFYFFFACLEDFSIQVAGC